MSCVEAFVIYTAKGDPLIYRLYRDNVEYVPIVWVCPLQRSNCSQ